jgi:hypothetical protein
MNHVQESARRLGPQIPHDPLEDAPAGWVYNPSSWAQRVPICVLAFLGFLVAGWMTLFQWDVLSAIWEPFFGQGSQTILTSHVSHALSIRITEELIITDAGLGALGYLADAIFGLAGGPARWKRMPWVVVVFTIFVVPFGLTTLTLFIIQPTLFDTWCTLCLISVAISLAMVPYAWDEFVASYFWIRGRMDAGASVWAALLGR